MAMVTQTVVTADLRLRDLHRHVAVVVVPRRQALDVGLEHVLVQVAGSGDEREEPLLLRLHDAVELAVAERLVALEVDLVDADEAAFLDDVLDVDLVLADRLRRVVDRRVEVALLAVELLRGFDALAGRAGSRMVCGRTRSACSTSSFCPLPCPRSDAADERASDAERGRPCRRPRASDHTVEEAHRVDGADALSTLSWSNAVPGCDARVHADPSSPTRRCRRCRRGRCWPRPHTAAPARP
jgi:hypothetical protein